MNPEDSVPAEAVINSLAQQLSAANMQIAMLTAKLDQQRKEKAVDDDHQ